MYVQYLLHNLADSMPLGLLPHCMDPATCVWVLNNTQYGDTKPYPPSGTPITQPLNPHRGEHNILDDRCSYDEDILHEEVSSGISAEIQRKLVKILASRILGLTGSPLFLTCLALTINFPILS